MADAPDPAPLPSTDGLAEEQLGWMERVFGTQRFFALFCVQIISALGDWVGFFAITVLAASISPQPEVAITLVIAARVVPGLFIAPFIGVVVDRIDRKKVMVTADLMRAVVFLLLPLVRTVPGLVVASLVLEVFTLMWSAAKESTVPNVVPTEKLTTANSLSLAAAYGTMPVAGPIQFLLVGALPETATVAVIATQVAPAFYFDAVSFVCSAVILWFFVFRGMPSTALRARQAAAAAAAQAPVKVEVPERNPVEEERTFLQRTFAEIREGWEFIFVNPVVRGVMIGLATGLVGGAMLVPLGPTFALRVIGDANKFSLFITALGLGVAVGVVSLGALQKRLPKERVFPLLVIMAGVSLFFGVSMSTFWLASLGVFAMGVCAGSVYVLGFTLLQEYTDDELRGRVFTTLLTLVRMCVLLALMLGPVLATIFNGFAEAATGATGDEVPTASLFGLEIAVPGVRLTLWLASVIIMAAGILAARSMQIGVRERLRSALGTTTTSQSKDRHPTTYPPEPHDGADQTSDTAGAVEAAAEGLLGLVEGPDGVPPHRRAEPAPPPLGELTSEIAPLDLPASMRPAPRERKDDL
ncbi:MAG: MFS transporter [Actinomycetes bacterium]